MAELYGYVKYDLPYGEVELENDEELFNSFVAGGGEAVEAATWRSGKRRSRRWKFGNRRRGEDGGTATGGGRIRKVNNFNIKNKNAKKIL